MVVGGIWSVIATGDYEVALIVYEWQTGERLQGRNLQTGQTGERLNLAQITR